MRYVLFGLLGSASLLVACSSDKKADSDSKDGKKVEVPVGSADHTTNMVIYDLSLTDDTATAHGVRRIFSARAARLDSVKNRYASDTVSLAPALRAVNDATDAQLKGLIADPGEYRKFLTHRNEYYAGTPFTRRSGDPAAAAPARSRAAESRARAAAAPSARAVAPAPQRRAAPVVQVRRRGNGPVQVRVANRRKVVNRNGRRKKKHGLFHRDRKKD